MEIKLNLDKDFESNINELSTTYGEKFQRMNGFHNDNLNFGEFIDAFTQETTLADVSIDGNANSSVKDANTLIQDINKPHFKLLGFNKLFYEIKKKYGVKVAEDWLRCEWIGNYYLHNAHSISFKPYCFAYDLDQVAEKGLFFTGGYTTTPANHLDTFNMHLLQFVSYTSNLSTGAVGLPSYLIYSFYFWKKDVANGHYVKSPEYYRDQQFQNFVYNMNQPFLRITQSAFTNISVIDREYFVELFGGRLYPDGTPMIDDLEEFMEYQKAFMEVISKVREEQYMTFPVLTYSLLYQNGKFVDEDFAKWCSDHNTKWNDSNFYIGNDVSVLSNCCRLLSDMKEMNGFINSIGGTSLKIGSVVVNTINLKRISMDVGFDEEAYLSRLSELTHTSLLTMDCVRDIIKRNVEKGILPNYSYGLVDMDKQFNTIGITAMYETMRDFGYIDVDPFGNESYSQKAMDFAQKIFDVLNDHRKNNSFDYPINIECVPAERANVVLCEKDREYYGAVNSDDYIYSNQWIPLMSSCTIDEKIRLGSILDKQCGGGQISHINLEAPFTNTDQAWEWLNVIAEKGVIYFAFNTKTSVCEDGHGFFGSTCPKDGKPVKDTIQRIVGFLVPRSTYSKERKSEFDNRTWFNLND